VECLTVSDDGSRVASIGFDHRLTVTDWQTAETVWSRRHYANGEVCFSPAGDTLVSSGYTDRHWAIMTWDAATGEPRATLNGHARVILGLAFTSDRTLYSWGADGSIRAWDLNLGRETEAYLPEPPC
jgi:WD40 repeat protein